MAYSRLNSNSVAGMTANEVKNSISYHAREVKQTVKTESGYIKTAVYESQAETVATLNQNTEVLTQQIESINTKIDSINSQSNAPQTEQQLHNMEQRLQAMEQLQQLLLAQANAHKQEMAELKVLCKEQSKQMLDAIKEIQPDILLTALEKQAGLASKDQSEDIARQNKGSQSNTGKFF